MMDVRFLTLAETEIDNAVSWYQEQSEDQSLNFLDELDRAVRLVAAFPLIAGEIDQTFVGFSSIAFPIL